MFREDVVSQAGDTACFLSEGVGDTAEGGVIVRRYKLRGPSSAKKRISFMNRGIIVMLSGDVFTLTERELEAASPSRNFSRSIKIFPTNSGEKHPDLRPKITVLSSNCWESPLGIDPGPVAEAEAALAFIPGYDSF